MFVVKFEYDAPEFEAPKTKALALDHLSDAQALFSKVSGACAFQYPLSAKGGRKVDIYEAELFEADTRCHAEAVSKVLSGKAALIEAAKPFNFDFSQEWWFPQKVKL
jgi:hypothetical protein